MSNKSHRSFVVVVLYPFDAMTSRPQSKIRDFMQKSSVPRNSHSLLVVSAGRLKDDDGHTLTPKESLLRDANLIPPPTWKKTGPELQRRWRRQPGGRGSGGDDFPAFHRRLHIIIYLSRHASQQAIYSQLSPNISANSWGARQSQRLPLFRPSAWRRCGRDGAPVHCGEFHKQGRLCWFLCCFSHLFPFLALPAFMLSCWLLLQQLTVCSNALHCTCAVWCANCHRKFSVWLAPQICRPQIDSSKPPKETQEHRGQTQTLAHVATLFSFF